MRTYVVNTLDPVDNSIRLLVSSKANTLTAYVSYRCQQMGSGDQMGNVQMKMGMTFSTVSGRGCFPR